MTESGSEMVVESAPRRRRSGPRPKGDRRKAQILEAAFEVFASDGYRTASMVQIAAACGVTRAGLLHHFPTKEALLEALAREQFARSVEPVGIVEHVEVRQLVGRGEALLDKAVAHHSGTTAVASISTSACGSTRRDTSTSAIAG